MNRTMMALALGALMAATARPAPAQVIHDVAVNLGADQNTVRAGDSFNAITELINLGTQGEWVRLVVILRSPPVQWPPRQWARTEIIWVPWGFSGVRVIPFATSSDSPPGPYLITADAYIIPAADSSQVILSDNPSNSHSQAVVFVIGFQR